MMLMQYYFLIFFIKAFVVGTHLNCLVKATSKGNSNEYPQHSFYKEVNKSTLAVL